MFWYLTLSLTCTTGVVAYLLLLNFVFMLVSFSNLSRQGMRFSFFNCKFEVVGN